MLAANQYYHKFDVELIEEQMLALLSLFISSKKTYQALGKNPDDRMPDEALQLIMERAISRLMLSIAPQLRMIDDRMNSSIKYLVKKESVGTLIIGMVDGYEERPEEELYAEFEKNNPLSLREACNKVIHSNFLEFKAYPTPKGIVMPSMLFQGVAKIGIAKKGGTKKVNKKHLWLANINPTDFVLEGLNLIKCFKEDPGSRNYLNSDLLDAANGNEPIVFP